MTHSASFELAAVAQCVGNSSAETGTVGTVCLLTCGFIDSGASSLTAFAVLHWGPVAYACTASSDGSVTNGVWLPVSQSYYNSLALERQGATTIATLASSPGNASETSSYCIDIYATWSGASEAVESCGDYGRLQWSPLVLSTETIAALSAVGAVTVHASGTTIVTTNGSMGAAELWADDAVEQMLRLEQLLFSPAAGFLLDVVLSADPIDECPGNGIAIATREIAAAAGAISLALLPGSAQEWDLRYADVTIIIFSAVELAAAQATTILNFSASTSAACPMSDAGTGSLLSYVRVLPLPWNSDITAPSSDLSLRAPVFTAVPFGTVLLNATVSAVDGEGSTISLFPTVFLPTAYGVCSVLALSLSSSLQFSAFTSAQQQLLTSLGASIPAGASIVSDSLPPALLVPILPVSLALGEQVNVTCTASHSHLVTVSPALLTFDDSGVAYSTAGMMLSQFTLTPVFQASNALAGMAIPIRVNCVGVSVVVSDTPTLPAYEPHMEFSLSAVWVGTRWPFVGNAIASYGDGLPNLRALATWGYTATDVFAQTFAIELPGSANTTTVNITLLGDTSDWLASGTTGHFLPSTEVFLGNVRCDVASVVADGTALTFYVPTAGAVCRSAIGVVALSPSNGSIVSECRAVLTVRNALLLAPPPYTPRLPSPLLLAVEISCPPFCPTGSRKPPTAWPRAVGLSSVDASEDASSSAMLLPRRLSDQYAVRDNGTMVTLMLPNYLATIDPAQFGFEVANTVARVSFATACFWTGKGTTAEVEGNITVGGLNTTSTPPNFAICTNSSNILSQLCGFGDAESCQACPPGAVCPGGWRAWAQPDYYTPTETLGLLQNCSPPIGGARCAGWNQSSGTTQCNTSNGYAANSILCAACNSSSYLDIDGNCKPCSYAPTAQRVALAVFFLAISLTGMAILFILVSRAVFSRRATRNSVKSTVKTSLDLVMWLSTAIQLQVMVARSTLTDASLPDGPPRLFYNSLAVFTFDGIALPPSCRGGNPSSYADIFSTQLSLFFAVTVIGLLQLINCAPWGHWCHCRWIERNVGRHTTTDGGSASFVGVGASSTNETIRLRTARERVRSVRTAPLPTTAASTSDVGSVDATGIIADVILQLGNAIGRRLRRVRPLESRTRIRQMRRAQLAQAPLPPLAEASTANGGLGTGSSDSMVEPDDDANDSHDNADGDWERAALSSSPRLPRRTDLSVLLHANWRDISRWIVKRFDRVTVLLLTLLLPATATAVFEVLMCDPRTTTVAVYRTMLQDGSTLRRLNISPAFPQLVNFTQLGTASALLDWDPEGRLPVNVSVLRINAQIVCLEGGHLPLLIVAALVLVFYVVGFPAFSFGWVLYCLYHPSDQVAIDLGAARVADAARQRAWVAAAPSAAARCRRRGTACLFGAGKRYSALGGASSPPRSRQPPVSRDTDYNGDTSLPPPPAPSNRRAITEADLLDAHALDSQVGWVAYFLHSEFRASMFWFRHVDLSLIILFAVTARMWPETRSSDGSQLTTLLIAGRAVVVWAALALVALAYATFQPYTPSSHYLIYMKSMHLVLLCFYVALNVVVSATAQSGASPSLQSTADGMLGFVMVASVGFLVFVIACFAWTANNVAVSGQEMQSSRGLLRRSGVAGQLIHAFSGSVALPLVSDDPWQATNPLRSSGVQPVLSDSAPQGAGQFKFRSLGALARVDPTSKPSDCGLSTATQSNSPTSTTESTGPAATTAASTVVSHGLGRAALLAAGRRPEFADDTLQGTNPLQVHALSAFSSSHRRRRCCTPTIPFSQSWSEIVAAHTRACAGHWRRCQFGRQQ